MQMKLQHSKYIIRLLKQTYRLQSYKKLFRNTSARLTRLPSITLNAYLYIKEFYNEPYKGLSLQYFVHVILLSSFNNIIHENSHETSDISGTCQNIF